VSRSLWSGAISFGLVHIPVELHPAEQRKALPFTMLDKRDLSPVGYRRVSKKTGKEVAWEQVVKGFEYEKDRFVVLSDEDFRRANVEATQSIDIAAFVPATDIPPQFFETPYYLVPTQSGKRAYALLRETLRSAKKVAVAQLVIRTTPHLAAVIPAGPVLLLDTLRYADEMRGIDSLSLPALSSKLTAVNAKEAELARKLVGDMSKPWNPDEYLNSYTQDLMKRVEEKINRGETEVVTEPEETVTAPWSADIIDLTTLLKRSLEGRRSRGTQRGDRAHAKLASASVRSPRKAPATATRAATARRKRA
jgi:DNA end-binding protein Ku